MIPRRGEWKTRDSLVHYEIAAFRGREGSRCGQMRDGVRLAPKCTILTVYDTGIIERG